MIQKVLSKLVLAFSLLGFVKTFDFLSKDTGFRVQSFLEQQVPLFRGNETHRDYFKILREDEGSVLVGARNIIYNLSLSDLTEHVEERIYWESTPEDRELCYMKGNSEDECQNYIRVLARVDSRTILVCGTNSYSPLCRHYINNGTGYSLVKQFSGKGYAPYDPRHNSTSLFTDGDLYAATVSDFSGTDSLIIKNLLRTEQYDYKHLNSPDFVSSLEEGEFVYFFFREAAVENLNCGKTIFSRVARVCKSDKGGSSNRFRNRWTTFLKARLNCSVSGDYPFYFDHIQSTTSFVQGSNGEKVIYMVFTTPDNSIPGSAVCRFSLQDINDAFTADFKDQENSHSNWLPIPKSQIPYPRPGTCSNGSVSDLNESGLNFIKNHCLMDTAVTSQPRRPVFTRCGLDERFTKISVDKDVRSLNGEIYDLLFIGTDKGRVLKVSIQQNEGESSSRLLEAVQLFDNRTPIRNLQIFRGDNPKESKLVVVTDDEVKNVPLYDCTINQTSPDAGCRECVSLQSPYCGWDLSSGLCVPLSSTRDVTGVLQNIETGFHTNCPSPPTTTTSTTTLSTTTTTTMTTTTSITTSTVSTTSTTTTEEATTTRSDNFGGGLLIGTPYCPTCTCTCPSSTLPATTSDMTESYEATQSRIEELPTNDLDFPYRGGGRSLGLAEHYLRAEPVFESESADANESKQDGVDASVESELASKTLLGLSGERYYPMSTLVLAVVLTGLLTLALGFMAGYLANNALNLRSVASVTSSKVSLVKPSKLDRPMHGDSGYNTPTNSGSSAHNSPSYSLPSCTSFPTPVPPMDFRNNNDAPPSLHSLPPKHYLKQDSGPHSIQHQPMVPISSSPGRRAGSLSAVTNSPGSRAGSLTAVNSRTGSTTAGNNSPGPTNNSSPSSTNSSAQKQFQSRASTLTEKAKISSLNTLQKVKRVYL